MAYAIPARILLSMLLLFESAFRPPSVMYTRSKVAVSVMPDSLFTGIEKFINHESHIVNMAFDAEKLRLL